MRTGTRALIAVVLMIGFYVLALGMAGILFWIPYVEFVHGERVHGRLALFCVFAGGAILWSIVPRIDRFPQPGPRLDRRGQGRLFELIESVARLTGQAMPSDVYLVPQVNAWVAQRGGFMGIGSRRVMGIGLPLIHSLTVQEFRAVLAHEFGHFYGGDTKLGPWVYKTRAAVARTIQALGSSASIGLVIVQAPFRAYGAVFLRITQAVSRAQEHAADALAARVGGAPHLASGLKSVHATAPLYEAFWGGEYAPLLAAGLTPPLGEGFERFLATAEVQDGLRRALAAALEKREVDPLDTHPALRLRLEAIGEAAEVSLRPSAPATAAILNQADELERQLLAHSFGEQVVSQLTPIAWADVGVRFYLPYVERAASGAATALCGVTPELLPEIAQQFFVRQKRLVRGQVGESYFVDQGKAATGFVGAALTLAALQAGGVMASRPCRPVLVHAAGELISFYDEFENLRSGHIEPGRWERIVAGAGIAGVDLGALGAAKSAE